MGERFLPVGSSSKARLSQTQVHTTRGYLLLYVWFSLYVDLSPLPKPAQNRRYICTAYTNSNNAVCTPQCASTIVPVLAPVEADSVTSTG